ncbi:hypothetical protein LCGC14_1281580 [marine sediment metagenome]|uniref:Uncharacterized protein n=1 Tax=marine sediment metagenome TaxID=412755 RepID=A0A0F9NBK8_9ZZZZ
MANRPAIFIPCHDLIEYQLLPCALLLLLDKLGEGENDPDSAEHKQQLGIFLADWNSLDKKHQEQFAARMARTLLDGVNLEYLKAQVAQMAHQSSVNRLFSTDHARN